MKECKIYRFTAYVNDDGKVVKLVNWNWKNPTWLYPYVYMKEFHAYVNCSEWYTPNQIRYHIRKGNMRIC